MPRRNLYLSTLAPLPPTTIDPLRIGVGTRTQEINEAIASSEQNCKNQRLLLKQLCIKDAAISILNGEMNSFDSVDSGDLKT